MKLFVTNGLSIKEILMLKTFFENYLQFDL